MFSPVSSRPSMSSLNNLGDSIRSRVSSALSRPGTGSGTGAPAYSQTGSWDQAHSMYFNPSGTGDSVNGTSNAQYVAKIHELINSWS